MNDEDVTVYGSVQAPEIYIDGFRGVMTNGHIAKINFFTNRLDGEDQKPKKIAALTLVLTVTDLVAVHKAIEETISNFKRDGIIDIVATETETKQ